jgi:hypothetical protein
MRAYSVENVACVWKVVRTAWCAARCDHIFYAVWGQPLPLPRTATLFQF